MSQQEMDFAERLAALNKMLNEPVNHDEGAPADAELSETPATTDYSLRKSLYKNLFAPWPELVCPLPQLVLTCPGLCIVPFVSNMVGYANLAVSFGLAGSSAGTGIQQTMVESVGHGNTTTFVSRLTEGPTIARGLKHSGFGFELIAGCEEHLEIAIAAVQWGIHAHLDQQRDVLATVLQEGGLVVGPYGIGNGRRTHYLITKPWGRLPTEAEYGEQSMRFFVCVSITTDEAAYIEVEGVAKLLYLLHSKNVQPMIDADRRSVV